ncbi:hypothetical protein EDD85DRAFT_961676 [Armillaria nabsnona]|nr:hypothetical protein EDD85DRAFT_961676 [Armillaria nabsnona]
MNNCDFELINTFCYPYAGKAGLRVTMDLHNILWLYNEFTDTESGMDTQKSGEIIIHTLWEADFDDGSWLCHMMKDFRERHIDHAGLNTGGHFIHHFCTYIRIVGKEAELRERSEDIYSYNMEQAKGHSCTNAMTVIMKSKQLDLQSAANFIDSYCKALLDQFEKAKEVLSAQPEEGYSDAVLLLKAFGDWV